MTVQKISLSNPELSYIINYEDGSDVKMLGSNDPAMDSLTDAITVLTDSVKYYAEVSDNFAVGIESVSWNKETVGIKYHLVKKEGWPKRQINCTTSVTYAGKREVDIDPRRLEILEDTEDLQKEVEKYLMGQRMQKGLPFQE